MARLQVLPLPDRWENDAAVPQYALVLDQVDGLAANAMAELSAQLTAFAERVGARSGMVTHMTVHIPANDPVEQNPTSSPRIIAWNGGEGTQSVDDMVVAHDAARRQGRWKSP